MKPRRLEEALVRSQNLLHPDSRSEYGVGAAASLVHVRLPDVPVPRPFVDDTHHVRDGLYLFLSAGVRVDTLLSVVSDLHALLARVQEVHDHFVVDLEVGTLHFKFDVDRLLVQLGNCQLVLVSHGAFDLAYLSKQVLKAPWKQSFVIWFALNGVSFAGARLAIGEDGSIIPLETEVNDRFPNDSENLFLLRPLSTDMIESVSLVLRPSENHCLVSDLRDALLMSEAFLEAQV